MNVVTGTFGGTSAAPHVSAKLVIPTHSVETHVRFLVDTGAQSTVLSPADSQKMRIDPTTIDRRTECTGVGGNAVLSSVEAFLTFSNDDGSRLYTYQIDLDILHRTSEIEMLPSLLGRDIINNWSILSSPIEAKFEAKILKAYKVFDTQQNNEIILDASAEMAEGVRRSLSLMTP